MEKLNQFFVEKDLAESTKELYSACVKLYEELLGKSLDELIQEADSEEEQGIRWKHRIIKDYLISYRSFLFANKSEGTAKRYLSCLKSVYRHFEIELQPLPSFNSKQIDKTYEMSYDDLLTKEEIIDAYYEANNVCKCIILFAMSSGMSKVDLLNLTVGNYINACNRYVTEDELIKQLNELKGEEVIPCFNGNRQKTGTSFVSFCSPEASEHITQYLIGRDAQIKQAFEDADDDEMDQLPQKLRYDDKLFDISKSHLTYVFRCINRKLKLGKVGKFTKFRCHALRKFHASRLMNLDNINWTVEEIDTLQGRKKDKTHRAYFHNDKEKLYQKYVESVDELMLFQSIHEIDKEEFEKVKTENNFFKREIVKNEKKLEEQQETINLIKQNQKELMEMLKQG